MAQDSKNTDPLEAKVDAMMNPNTEPTTAGAPAVSTAPPVPRKHPVAPPVEKPVAVAPPTPPPAQPAATEAVADESNVQPLQIDTPETDAAIKDIVTLEADEVLAAQDAGIEAALTANEAAEPAQEPRRGHPLFWTVMLAIIVLAVAAAIVLTSPGLSPSFAP